MAQKLSRRSLATYAVDQLIAGVSEKKLARQLAAYLIESGRRKELDLVIRDIQYALAERGYVAGTVTSAYELSQATQRSLEAFTKKQTSAKTVSLDTIVDKAVLGGVKISLPGKEFDGTIARALTTLKTRYKKA